MSIKHFVKGKYTCTVKGDYTIYSNENIVHNASKYIDQKGIDTGIIYKEPKEINPNDTPIKEIDVSLNLFFDGTGNNKTNTEHRFANDTTYNSKSNKEDDSYTNDYSNVARGYDAIKVDEENQVAEYIEGIGTEDGESDTTVTGKGLGSFGTGIKAKVEKGCIKGAKAVSKKYEGRELNTLKINVFGFSRGAAAARHFVHVVTSEDTLSYAQGGKRIIINYPYSKSIDKSLIFDNPEESTRTFLEQYGFFGACLLQENVMPKKIVFNFVGLYDTVASYGIVHSNDTTDLGLDSIKKAYFILQLCADDEYRSNFRLTNINSTGTKGLSLTLPGVHSDIGGSYIDEAIETTTVFKGLKLQCENMKKLLIKEGWFDTDPNNKENKLEIEETLLAKKLVGTRKLSNQYDKISLERIFTYSKYFGTIYNEERINKKHLISDTFLRRIQSQLLDYMYACNKERNTFFRGEEKRNYLEHMRQFHYKDFIEIEDLKKLRKNYLHWSVNYGDFVHGEEVSGVVSESLRKRKIQPG